ncbi:MAG: S8 family serine peptidase [Geobacteraceae bacterium]
MMKKTLFVLGLSIFFAALFSPALFAATQASRYVVLFKNDHIPVDAHQLIEGAGGRIVRSFPSVGIVVATSENPVFESSLAFSTPVESVSSARFRPLPGGSPHSGGVVTPADDFFSYQWNIRRVKADKAWRITRGTHNTTVAVIDTGIAWNHPDLTQNVVYAACFTSLGACAWKSPGGETCPCTPYPDLDPHGTAVASVIAASSAGGRMVGVGPGLAIASYNVFELIAPDGIPQEFSYDDSVWSAMFDAAERGYRVMNISLGDPLFDRTDDKTIIAAWTRVVKEILRKNVTIVASAGNNGLKLTGQTVHIPSDLPGVISVGATGIRPEPVYPLDGSFDVPAFYSNFGKPIDLVAPGGDCGVDGPCDDFSVFPPNWYEYGVLSAFVCPGCGFTADTSPFVGVTGFSEDPGCIATASCQTDYTWFSGTSLAAPHVAAVAGLIIDRFPYFNSLFVTTILKVSAEHLGDHPHFGSGMVDAYRAVGGR